MVWGLSSMYLIFDATFPGKAAWIILITGISLVEIGSLILGKEILIVIRKTLYIFAWYLFRSLIFPSKLIISETNERIAVGGVVSFVLVIWHHP